MEHIIAIDGPAAAGKGTLARSIAQVLDYAYLDTGTLYRAVGLRAAAAGDIEDAGAQAMALSVEDLRHPDLRSVRAGDLASRVAAQPKVRAALVAFQHSFGRVPPEGKRGAVLDGRDIGTVIFPQAKTKLFITASAIVRARRRWEELPEAGRPPFAEILAAVKARDARDMDRADAPLRPAAEAHQIDTSKMTRAAVLELALSIIAESR